jgi:hypothetical protein
VVGAAHNRVLACWIEWGEIGHTPVLFGCSLVEQ